MVFLVKNYIQDIFSAHPEYVKLFKYTFSPVLVMDLTYKTNQYKMSLFENIVGLTLKREDMSPVHGAIFGNIFRSSTTTQTVTGNHQKCSKG